MTQTKISPIDVAIVTALQLEREAICRHLEALVTVQDPNQPYTYYRGRVSLRGHNEQTDQTEHYEVVVVQLDGMGNLGAGITTNALITRWQPSVVLMVGIAGGVKGKVQLGDVVVADAVYYYELGKITGEGQQPRPQEFRSDRLLYSRAQAYEDRDWKVHIEVTRPGSTRSAPLMLPALPGVHFGYIASGEKVIADATAITGLMRAQPQLRAVAMEGAGVAWAASQQATPPRFLEIRGICDLADASKSDKWQPYAAEVAAAFTVGLLRTQPVLPALRARASIPPTAASPLVVLRAQSLRRIDPQEIAPALRDTEGQTYDPIALDFTDLVTADRLTDPTTAARRLADPHGRLFAALARRDQVDLAFHGLVHIPLAVLAGYLVTDRQPVRLFDYHPVPTMQTWRWPTQVDDGPPLAPNSVPTTLATGDRVAVVRISVSYAVTTLQTCAVIPAPRIEVDLSVPDPQRSIMTSEPQVRRYGAVFRSELDRLVRVVPEIERIHLFYAGPVAFAFHLGQQISANIHPPVTVWNFRQGAYEWGLDLSATAMQAAAIITTAEDMRQLALVTSHE